MQAISQKTDNDKQQLINQHLGGLKLVKLTKLNKSSAKRKSHLDEIIAEDMSTEFLNKKFRSFSQTSWTVCGKSIFTFYKKPRSLWYWWRI